MRYIIITFPMRLKNLLSTDFRLIAFILAIFLCIKYQEITVIDTDTDETIFQKCKRHPSLQSDRCGWIKKEIKI